VFLVIFFFFFKYNSNRLQQKEIIQKQEGLGNPKLKL